MLQLNNLRKDLVNKYFGEFVERILRNDTHVIAIEFDQTLYAADRRF